MENEITKNFELFHFQYCFISKKDIIPFSIMFLGTKWKMKLLRNFSNAKKDN